MKVSVVLIFCIDGLSTYLITIGILNGLGAWFIPMTILLLAVPTVYAIVQSLSNNKRVT